MADEQLPAAAGHGGKEPPMIGHQAVIRSVRVAMSDSVQQEAMLGVVEDRELTAKKNVY
jgi:hypothetical protein